MVFSFIIRILFRREAEAEVGSCDVFVVGGSVSSSRVRFFVVFSFRRCTGGFIFAVARSGRFIGFRRSRVLGR